MNAGEQLAAPSFFPDRIPAELQEFRQWIVWRLEESDGAKPTKVPYNAVSGALASVTNPATWCDFATAVAAATAPGSTYSGIGFVLTRADPYSIIDLDDTKGDDDALRMQLRIHEAFDSYSERSPSRTGLHIVVRGAVPSGRRRGKAELYHSERYMTFTGDVFDAKPIADRQEALTQLWHEMGKGGAAALYDGNSPEREPDQIVLDRAMRAQNGTKFYALHVGNWQTYYSSQSEADFAYVDMLAFYTQNRAQIDRMFLASKLGARDKAQRSDYRNYMIDKSFDRMLPPLDFDTLTNAIRDRVEQAKRDAAEPHAPPPPLDDAGGEIEPPPGLLGDIARFIYSAAPRPVPDIAMAGAIGFLAGVVGRAYNVSGTGLNQYVLLLAPTGTGKEAIASGISRLVKSLTGMSLPGFPPFAAFDTFRGPSDMASGQGLLKALSRRNPPSVYCIVGEFGLKFKQMADERAQQHDTSLLRALLDLYNKSGRDDTVGETVYSDKEKNTATIVAPAVSIIGESTPETFYSTLTEGMIANGLLPRFTIIEYNGPRPRRNPAAQYEQPNADLVERLGKLGALSLHENANNSVIQVATEPDAEAFLNEFDIFCDDQINGTGRTVTRELWNRAHIKALKLSGLIAVGVDPYTPRITLEFAKWARQQVERDVRRLLARFESGEFGVISRVTDHDKQTAFVLKKCLDWITKAYDELPKVKPPYPRALHDAHIVPLMYLSRTCLCVSAFKNDSNATQALKRAIQNLADEGTLRRLTPVELLPFQFNGEAYAITNAGAI